MSDFQGQVDWGQVAASGASFAFCKATEGVGFTCGTFPSNWAGMRAAGLVRGAYHFARPAWNGAEAEAQWFLGQVGDLQPGDLLALDIEAGDGDLAGWALAWLRYVEAAVGFKPLLYSYAPFLAEHGMEGRADLAEYPLWVASYSDEPPPTPVPWNTTALWQFTDAANLAGITGRVDESRCYVDIRLLGKP